MRHSRPLLLLVLSLIAGAAAPAAANVPHTVGTGETLWSIAARNGFTTRSFAAANGLSPDAHVLLGTTLQVPSVNEAAVALQSASAAPATSTSTSTATSTAAAPSASGGSYVVQRGDTLTGIAARAGVSLDRLAAANGLSAAGVLLAGNALRLPAPGQATAAAAASAPAASSSPGSSGHVSAATIGQSAIARGVPASLAKAIAWQESGFHPDAVSSANARGVMQVLPDTASWVRSALDPSLTPATSVQGNVDTGVTYLHYLLRQSGGDPATAAAGYYQGLSSVRRIGLLPDTQRYVANVLALRGRFLAP